MRSPELTRFSIEESFQTRLVMYARTWDEPEYSPFAVRFAVVNFVVLLHLLVFTVYWLQPEAPAVLANEMSISFANMQMPQADVVPKPKPREQDSVPSEKPAVENVTQPALRETTPSSPVVLDTELDYRADYLNNPRPPYPMVARRLGYHGKVVLDVEVLAECKAGDVKLHQSSGYDILDNAALQTKRLGALPQHAVSAKLSHSVFWFRSNFL